MSSAVLFQFVVLAAACSWAFVRSGVGIVPGLSWHIAPAAIWPARPENPDEWFLSDSPVGLIIYRALDTDSENAFLLMHVVAIFSALGLLAAWSAVNVVSGERWRAMRITVLAPVGAVLLTWVGSYDAFSVLSWALFFWVWRGGRPALVVLSGILIGFQHFEHGLFGLFGLFLVWLGFRGQLPAQLQRSNPLWLLPGLLTGKLLLISVFAASGTALSGRSRWVSANLGEWSVTGLSSAPLLIWSLFAGWWSVVVYISLRSRERSSRMYVLGAIVIGLVATILSGDRPRVFVLVLFPTVVLLGVVFLRLKTPRTTVWLVEAMVWLAPPVIFWAGDVANENVIDPLLILTEVLISSK